MTLVSWIAVLATSDLPDIIVHYATASAVPPWLFLIKVAVLVAFFVLTILWKKFRPLWQFALVMAVFLLAAWVTSRIREAGWWQQIFPVKNTSFYLGYIGIYILDLMIVVSVIVVLWFLKSRKRTGFFLVKGDLRAAIEPVRWLGIGKGNSWMNVGWVIALVAGVLVALPTVLAIKPTSTDLARALPLLPGVLLFAAVNAFGEEVYFRLSFLSTLSSAIAKGHVLLISSVFFGFSHWLYGSPGGIIGFLMTGFLAWLLGKSILETRGMAWAWFIHFVPDVVVFLSYALLWFR